MEIKTQNANLMIQRFELGPIGTNCYIVTNQKDGLSIVIDPAGGGEVIKNHLNELNTKVAYILNTHGHFDHIGANAFLQNCTGAKLYVHAADGDMLINAGDNRFGIQTPASKADEYLVDGQILPLGDMQIKVLHTPGHSKGGVCFLLDNSILFAGDTLFQYSIGRTDLEGGNYQELISSIQNVLFLLPDDVVVLPGHGEGTTIGAEKRSNPYVRA